MFQVSVPFLIQADKHGLPPKSNEEERPWDAAEAEEEEQNAREREEGERKGEWQG